MLARQAGAAAGSRGEEGLARAVRWAEARAYAVPFICAISDTSPTSKLNVTFLRTCAIEPKDAGRSRGQRTAAYNCRNVGVCVMLAGSVPVRRFSPNNLPGRHQCRAALAQTERAWATYRWAMDGIEETKAGNQPVSAFRVKFLRQHPCLRRSGDNCVRKGRASPTALNQTPRGSRAYVAKRSKLPLRGCGGDRLGRACGS